MPWLHGPVGDENNSGMGVYSGSKCKSAVVFAAGSFCRLPKCKSAFIFSVEPVNPPFAAK
jgi:hypothetical protein